jgi:hypothetical protein
MRLYYYFCLRGARKRFDKANEAWARGVTLEEQMDKDPLVVAKWFIAHSKLSYYLGKLS